MEPSTQIVAIGHALVDVLSNTDDDHVASLGLGKGTMTLIDDDQSQKIYAGLGPAVEASGGSAANTAACLASLGASVQFIGKVADDDLGVVFSHDIRAAGVRFEAPPFDSGHPTERQISTGISLIMVTPDAEKTMCTNLGIGSYLAAEDIDTAAIASAQIVYFEGYLCGKDESRSGVEAAIAAARAGATLVALSASDPAWVDLHRDELWSLLDRVDILFANEAEALGLSGQPTLEGALDALAARVSTVAVTLGAEGCVVHDRTGVVRVPAEPVGQVVDTTGAGDSFAAGFMFGMVSGRPAADCARLGGLAAAEVVGHLGARPLARLSEMAAAAGMA
ncbi:MAG: adenosine kinase [Acidimicrobiales bacterium]|nr:adenosine kinase [Acidimicrobiales bacterium]